MYGSYYQHTQQLGDLVEKMGSRATVVYYERLHEDFDNEIARLAEFLGVSLSKNKLAAIAHEVSFDNMTHGDSNKATTLRKGVVGDYKSHLTEEHWQAMDKLFEKHLGSVKIAQPMRKWL